MKQQCLVKYTFSERVFRRVDDKLLEIDDVTEEVLSDEIKKFHFSQYIQT